MLFSPYKIKDLKLKNRIVMSPMSMYACEDESGIVQTWHKIHYPARAIGGVGLILVEATAITMQGRMTPQDLGIWNNSHIEGLSELTALIHDLGTSIGIQLSHAGRKAKIDGSIIAPSPIPYEEGQKVPEEMTINQIKEVIHGFVEGANRAKKAGFDVIEIHAAHGYLIHEFLSPLSNNRQDEYGGSRENRFRFLKEVIEGIKTVWEGPLFVRISADEYHPEGSLPEDYVYYGSLMKELGVDLVDVSTGGLVGIRPQTYPGYQVPFADMIRSKANIPTGAVGLIKEPEHAEEILRNNRADLIFLGRELMWNPHWAYMAASRLGVKLELPKSYSWSWITKL
ncbi:NADPH dehydrogenase [Paenibacillus polymyxa]|uniref:NADPH dehydrogenase NamA n=1 Tax=Paenibacillus polymyxa TaxID=1406 RepID=UPI000D78ACA0|nr:NADPH dehydrogenase NamA [Paenibacillus polymyxa]VUG07062.1 NADPH dehydrogenase [Paenibacillus polymyxa]